MSTAVGLTPRSTRRREFLREPPWWFRDVVLALVVGLALFSIQAIFEYERTQQAERRAELAALQAERQENLRFVRDRSSSEAIDRPFTAIDLQGQVLAGLQLSGADFSLANLAYVDFQGADLKGASFEQANLYGASFVGARLDGAEFDRALLADTQFAVASLGNALFVESNMRGANFGFSVLDKLNIVGSDLSYAKFPPDIDQANISKVCYNEATEWPTVYDPPPLNRSACQLWLGNAMPQQEEYLRLVQLHYPD